MAEALPMARVPGLLCTARRYAAHIPELWQLGPVTIATHTHAESMGAIARAILEPAPPRFGLAGLSMGGYISLRLVQE